MRLIQDDTKQTFPDAMPEPGGTVTLSVADDDVTTFEPSLVALAHYYLRATGNIRFAIHNADYDFVAADNALLEAGEVRCLMLGDTSGRWVTLSLQSEAGDVDVTIEKLQ